MCQRGELGDKRTASSGLPVIGNMKYLRKHTKTQQHKYAHKTITTQSTKTTSQFKTQKVDGGEYETIPDVWL